MSYAGASRGASAGGTRRPTVKAFPIRSGVHPACFACGTGHGVDRWFHLCAGFIKAPAASDACPLLLGHTHSACLARNSDAKPIASRNGPALRTG